MNYRRALLMHSLLIVDVVNFTEYTYPRAEHSTFTHSNTLQLQQQLRAKL